MSTLAPARPATRARVPYVGRRDAASPFVARIREALRRLPHTGISGKRHEALYKATSVLTSLERLVTEELRAGAAAVELEGFAQAVYEAIRGKMAHLLTAPGETLAEALEREQAREGTENSATLAFLNHPTPGTAAALETALVAERVATDQLLRHLGATRRRFDLEASRA